MHDSIIDMKDQSSCTLVCSELEIYKKEPLLKFYVNDESDERNNPLNWWKSKELKSPIYLN